MQYGYCAANLNAPHVEWMRNKLEWKYMSPVAAVAAAAFRAHNITIWLALPLAVNLLLFFFSLALLCFARLSVRQWCVVCEHMEYRANK